MEIWLAAKTLLVLASAIAGGILAVALLTGLNVALIRLGEAIGQWSHRHDGPPVLKGSRTHT